MVSWVIFDFRWAGLDRRMRRTGSLGSLPRDAWRRVVEGFPVTQIQRSISVQNLEAVYLYPEMNLGESVNAIKGEFTGDLHRPLCHKPYK